MRGHDTAPATRRCVRALRRPTHMGAVRRHVDSAPRHPSQVGSPRHRSPRHAADAYARQPRRRAARIAVGRPARRHPRHQRRLHAHSAAPCGVPAGGADGAGAGAGIHLRRGGHLLRGEAGAVGGGHRRADRELPVPALFHRDGPGDGHHRAGGAAGGRGRVGGGLGHRGAGAVDRGTGVGAVRHRRRRVGARPAGADGRGRVDAASTASATCSGCWAATW